MSHDSDTTEPVDTHHGDDIDALGLASWGIISVSITLAFALCTYGLYHYGVNQQRIVKSYDVVDTFAVNKLNDQAGELVQPVHWIDEEKGIVYLPIDRTMDLTIKKYKLAD